MWVENNALFGKIPSSLPRASPRGQALRDLSTLTSLSSSTNMPSPSATLGAGSTGFTDVNQHAIFCQHCPL
ncbi:MAG: hypothetical protein LBK18_03215 [Prevotellaceae bacterium]|nr:hypothetical protein [Prevotellaceae bacterium]